MPAYGGLDPAYAGLLINGEDFIDSGVCQDAAGLGYGVPVFAAEGDDNQVFNAKSDVLQFVLSAAFVTGNTIAGTVNGVAYSVPFATSDAATFAALVTALNTNPVTDASGNFATRTITIATTGTTASATGTVTGGASQATVTVNTSTGYHLLGVSIHTHKEYAGVGQYNFQDVVGILRIGQVWVAVEVLVQSNQAAYWNPATGFWSNVAGGNFQTPYYFRKSAAAGGYAILDVTKSPAALVG